MNAWWKIGLVAAAILLVFDAGYYVKGKFDEADQAEVLRDQIRADRTEQDRVAGVAKAAEADLLAQRQKLANLNKRWSAYRAQKDHTDCRLDPDAIGLLKDATSGASGLPR